MLVSGRQAIKAVCLAALLITFNESISRAQLTNEAGVVDGTGGWMATGQFLCVSSACQPGPVGVSFGPGFRNSSGFLSSFLLDPYLDNDADGIADEDDPDDDNDALFDASELSGLGFVPRTPTESMEADTPTLQAWSETSTLDLSPYDDEIVQVRFRHAFEGGPFYNGDTYNYIGVFIDDFAISDAEQLLGGTLASNITATNYPIGGQTSGHYYYKVRGINAADALGEWSNSEDVFVDVTTSNMLTVSSDYGAPAPPVGGHTYVSGTELTCAVAGSPVEVQDITSWSLLVCTGWVGSGSIPALGSTTNTGSFTLTEDSSITWQWVVTDLVLSNQTLKGTSDFVAPDTIVARDGFVVEDTGTVGLEAGEEIRLQAGFTAKSGSVFRAKIVP